jgi:hypothetical protein
MTLARRTGRSGRDPRRITIPATTTYR